MRALILEDDPVSRESLTAQVAAEGFAVESAGSLGEARRHLAAAPPHLFIAELVLPDGSATELLEQLRDAETECVLITADASVESAVAALRLGAMDYLIKPIDRERLRGLIDVVRHTSPLKAEVTELRGELKRAGRFGTMVGAAEPMQEIYRLIEKVARTDATVFVTGESGTGKELVAEAIHRLSPRNRKAFLPLNCGAISSSLIESELFGHERGSFTGAERRHQGHFERAHGGTLFLDEITEMPFELQVKLLRVLETGRLLRVGGTKHVEVDVRTIVASNRDPEEAVRDEALREDLYYRLRVFPIHLPPLRDRDGDVELLTRHFLAELNRQHGTRKSLSDDALDLLVAHSWPGNVRELKNVLERAYILAEERIAPRNLPRQVRLNLDAQVRSSGDYLKIRIGSTLAEAEQKLILATLEEHGGKRKETAAALGISLKTLYNRLKKYGAS